jgi:capsular polysaccharide biosynthesis protein
MLQAPQIEREYLAFQRNYDQAVSDYNEVREKQTEAQQALDLETSEKGERYVLQRSPVEPISAAFPNRLAIIILGAIFAFVCSFGAVLIAEAFDAKVRSVRDLKNLTGMPPIAIIPVIETQATRRKRVYAWSFSIVGVASLLLFMISIQI